MHAPRRVALALQLDEPYPQHQEVMFGVQRYAREHSAWHLIVDEHPGYRARGRAAASPAYDGVIARASPQLQQRLRKQCIPLVNTWYQHARPDTAGVYLDAAQIGRLAADHLTARGFQRLGFLGVANFRQARELGETYAQTAADEGFVCMTDELENSTFSDRRYWTRLHNHLDQFLDQLTPPTGILVIIPWAARLLITLCQKRGWHVPQDIAVIVLDNVRSVVELPPQITSIDTNYERVGYEAAALLEQLIAGKSTRVRTIFIPPKGMIGRESTDYFAVEDEVVRAALLYISKRLSQRLTVPQIAAGITASPRSLQRRFEAALGRPVSDEIRRLRLELAKRLLGDRELQVGQVARAAGFGSAIAMNQVFHRELGMGPRAYRKSLTG
jgi:LacI family transcriptional regulator